MSLIYSIFTEEYIDIASDKKTIVDNCSTEITDSLARHEIFIKNKSISVKWFEYERNRNLDPRFNVYKKNNISFLGRFFHKFTSSDWCEWIEVTKGYGKWYEEEYQKFIETKYYHKEAK